MKKILIFLLFMILLFLPLNVLADSAKSIIVMDVDSGRVLYQKNADDKKLIASTTKIMTCLIVLENSDVEDEIVVGDEVLSMYGTNIYIEPGEKLKIKDLLYGLMLRSGNDAAITLAYNTLGEDAFLQKMNAKAKELGMKNTYFQNPHGLDEETENYSTAYDMALLSKYAYGNYYYRKIINTKKYSTKSSTKSYTWYNRMSLLNKYKNCIGGKNGYTPKAGKSLVSYAKKDNLVLTIVSLSDSDIYATHENLYNTYFSKYKNYTILDKSNFTFDNYYIKKSFKYPLTSDEIDYISTLLRIDYDKKNKVVGDVEIRLHDKMIGKIEVYKRKNKKEKKSLFDRIINLFTR